MLFSGSLQGDSENAQHHAVCEDSRAAGRETSAMGWNGNAHSTQNRRREIQG